MIIVRRSMSINAKCKETQQAASLRLRFPTSHFPLPTSHFPLPTSYFLLPTSFARTGHAEGTEAFFDYCAPINVNHCEMQRDAAGCVSTTTISNFPLPTSHFLLPTSYFLLHLLAQGTQRARRHFLINVRRSMSINAKCKETQQAASLRFAIVHGNSRVRSRHASNVIRVTATRQTLARYEFCSRQQPPH